MKLSILCVMFLLTCITSCRQIEPDKNITIKQSQDSIYQSKLPKPSPKLYTIITPNYFDTNKYAQDSKSVIYYSEDEPSYSNDQNNINFRDYKTKKRIDINGGCIVINP